MLRPPGGSDSINTAALRGAHQSSISHPELPCILDTNVSDVAVGGVLSQVINGVERPIAFFSKVLGSTQKNYCTTRRELLA